MKAGSFASIAPMLNVSSDMAKSMSKGDVRFFNNFLTILSSYKNIKKLLVQ